MHPPIGDSSQSSRSAELADLAVVDAGGGSPEFEAFAVSVNAHFKATNRIDLEINAALASRRRKSCLDR